MIRSKRKMYAVPPSGSAPDAENSYAKVLALVGQGKRVLEFGCATGYVTKFMKDNGCSVTGIEINPVAADEARAHADEVVVADLDVRALDDILPGRLFDVALFGDILEHLRDPWRVLDETRTFLGPKGFAVMSIPNVAHGAVRLALLRGTFRYAKLGLLDDDHLRFFTLRSVQELCLRSGYRIESIDRTKVPLFEPSNLVPHVEAADFDPAIIADVQSDPDHDTLQFIIRAVPMNDEDRVSALVEQVLDADEAALEAASKLERQERELGHLETRLAQQLELSSALTTSFEQAQGRIAELEIGLEHVRESESQVARIPELEAQVAHIPELQAEALASQNRALEAERLATSLRERHAELEQSVAAAIDRASLSEAEAERAARELPAIEAALTDAGSQVDQLRSDVAAAGQRWINLERDFVAEQQRARQAERELLVARDHRATSDAELGEQRGATAELIVELARARECTAEFEASLAETTEQNAVLKSALRAGEEAILALRAAVSHWETRLAEADERGSALSADLAEGRDTVERLQTAVDELSPVAAQAEAYKDGLAELKAALAQLEADLAAEIDRSAELERSADERAAEAVQLRNELEIAEGRELALVADLAALAEVRAEADERESALSADLAESRDTVERLQTAVDELSPVAAQAEAYKDGLAETKAALAQLEADLAAEIDRNAELERSASERAAEAVQLRNELAIAEGRELALVADVAALAEVRAEVDRLRAEGSQLVEASIFLRAQIDASYEQQNALVREHEARLAHEILERQTAEELLDGAADEMSVLLARSSAAATELNLARERNAALLDEIYALEGAHSHDTSVLQAQQEAAAAELVLAQQRNAELLDEVYALQAAHSQVVADLTATTEALALFRDEASGEIASLRETIESNAAEASALKAKADARSEMRQERDIATREAAALKEQLSEIRREMSALQDAAIADMSRLTEVETLLREREEQAGELTVERASLAERLTALEGEYQNSLESFAGHVAREVEETRQETDRLYGALHAIQTSPWWRAKLALRNLLRKREKVAGR